MRLTPNGGADRIDGVTGEGVIRARVSAPPEDGKANAALEKLLAKALGVAKSRVQVARGAAARIKQVEIAELDAEALSAFIAALPKLVR